MIGSRLGSYEITAKLGEGGMGAVYRAHDLELERDVAVKVLPEAFTSDPDRVARFEREAKLLASLNHPNIGQIYVVGSAKAPGDGEAAPTRRPGTTSDPGSTGRGTIVHYLVMELVEGETLGERLRRAPLPVADAIPVARQIAEALEAAHDRGVVHRDLKPDNVKIDPGGRVKVLDFGLAKAMEPTGGATDPSVLANSPTLTAAGTLQGTILGTAAYMSPEQAKGLQVDRRADIWAFGVVLHEMLTGVRLFAGDSVAETLAGVLAQDVDLSTLPPGTPPAIRRLLRRCLVRDPRNRLHDVADARIVLDEALSGVAEETAPSPEAASPRRRGVPLATAIGLALLLSALAFALGLGLRAAPESPEPPAVSDNATVRKLTLGPGLEAEPSFSPDGSSIAYTTDDRGSLDVAILPLAGGEERRVASSPADEAHPAWSPDGTRIAYTRARGDGSLQPIVGLDTLTAFVQGQGGDIYLVPSAGGTPTRLAEDAAFPTWSPDSRQVAFASQRSGVWNIWRISADGGMAIAVTDDDTIDFQPAWSPDGAWIAFASASGLRVTRADGTGEPRTMVAAVREILSPSWSPDGNWIYFSQARGSSFSLWRVRFDAALEPQPRHPERISLGESSDVDLDLDATGRRLVWSKVEYQPDAYALDLDSGEMTRLTNTTCAEVAVDMNPDGRVLLLDTNCRGGRSLETLDVETGLRQAMSPAGVEAFFGRWSPDGRSVVYLRSGAGGETQLVLRSRDALDDRVLARFPGDHGVQPPGWMPRGDGILVSHGPGTTGGTVSLVSLSGEMRHVLESELGLDISFPVATPDGTIVVYQVEGEGRLRQIWTAKIDGSDPRPVTDSELEHSHPKIHRRRPDEALVVINHENLALVSLATGELTYLTDFDQSTHLVDYPTWGPDGKTVYFDLTKKVADLFLLENPE